MRPVLPWTGVTIELDAENGCLKFCGDKCQSLLYPSLGSAPQVSVTVDKKAPGKVVGPVKLQIIKSVPPQDCRQSHQLEFIELCISDSSFDKVPPKTPYVIWQIRTIKMQKFMDFFITNQFEVTDSVWMSKCPQLNLSLDDSAVKKRVLELLQNVLMLVLSKIGYSTLDAFIADN